MNDLWALGKTAKPTHELPDTEWKCATPTRDLGDEEQDGEECLTCETEVINGGTWGYCAECWDEHGIKVGFGSDVEDGNESP